MDERRNGMDGAALARVRHDLLTPLNGVVGYAGILREDAVDLGLLDLVPPLDAILRDARLTVSVLSAVVRADGAANLDEVAREARTRAGDPVRRVSRATRDLLAGLTPASEGLAPDLRRVRDAADELLLLLDRLREAYARHAGA